MKENKKIILDFFEAHGRGDIDAAAACYADKGINHGMEVTRDLIRMVLNDLATTFEGATEVRTVVAEGDWVTMRTTTTGKHVGQKHHPDQHADARHRTHREEFRDSDYPHVQAWRREDY